MHRLSSAFVLGYHGCDRLVGNRLLRGAKFGVSQNAYDWLGHGVYFWEANPLRGLDFAHEWRDRGKISDPFVVGAVIDLGLCWDLVSSAGIMALQEAYRSFCAFARKAKQPIPRNWGRDKDRLLRELDCAVINHGHKLREVAGLDMFQTVRGVFVEGKRAYRTAGFFEKTHVQICVRDLSCIKGIFRVPPDQLAV